VEAKRLCLLHKVVGAVVVVWVLDLQLPVQSVPITINIVSLNPVHGKVYWMKHYVIKVCQ